MGPSFVTLSVKRSPESLALVVSRLSATKNNLLLWSVKLERN